MKARERETDMRTSWGLPVAMMAVVVLSACTMRDVVKLDQDLRKVAFGECLGATPDPAAAVDWSTAQAISVTIRQDDYDPMILFLKRDQPYVITIANRDDSGHTFRARRFFQESTVAGVTVGGEALDDDCIIAVDIPALKTAELRVVPTREGTYDFTDDLLAVIPSLVDIGSINVEAPR